MKRLTLLVTPLMTLSLLASCGQNKPGPDPDETYTIIWKNDDGNVLATEEDAYHYGDVPCYKGATPSKESTAQYAYVFDGWTPKLTTVTGDATYTAKYKEEVRKYTVTWKNYDGTVLEKDENVPYGEIPHFDKDEPSRPEDDDGKYDFIGWDGDIGQGIAADTTFTAQFDITHKYKVKADNDSTSRLSFTKDNVSLALKPAIAYEDDAFTFKMTLNNNVSNDDYKIPKELNIYVGDTRTPLAPGNYSIVETVPDEEANVTINADRINDDIIISGEAIVVDKYRVNLKSFCTNHDFEGGLQMCGQKLEIAFTQDGSYACPNEETISINIDNSREWFTPKSDSTHQYCSYNTTSHILTINANVVDSNLTIRAFSPSANVLESLNWETINEISMSKLATYFFHIGDTKTVSVNGVNHNVRIIDFNHDDLKDNKGKAGITFEFTNVITDSSQKEITIQFGSDNCNFPQYPLNDLLNKTTEDNCIFNKLEKNLQKAIKEVAKIVATYHTYPGSYMPSTYLTRLFPLAHDEITTEQSPSVLEGEGETYQYYKEHTEPKDRIKHVVSNEPGAKEYWLRSPAIPGAANAFNIRGNGNFFSDLSYSKVSVAPAFCV